MKCTMSDKRPNLRHYSEPLVGTEGLSVEMRFQVTTESYSRGVATNIWDKTVPDPRSA